MSEMQVRIGADVNSAVAGINKVNQSLNTLPVAANKANLALSKLPQTSSAATQSLVNLSRVAQDAPYGFIGIANNLNPLLESFQRLKVSTGSTGGALSALKKELTGAGGIGLAIGVVSSLLVVFGDKLFGSTVHLSKAELAFGKLSSAVVELGNVLDETKRKLDFGVDLQKLNLQLSGLSGKALEIGGIQAERTANIKFIEDATNALSKLERSKSVFDKYRDGIISAGNAAKQIGGKESALSQLLRSFSDVTQIPESLITKLSTKDAAALKQYQQIAKAVVETKNKIDVAFEKDVLLGKQSLVKQLPEIKTGSLRINPEKIEIRNLGPLDLEFPSVIRFKLDTRSSLQKMLDGISEDINKSSNLEGAPLKLNLSLDVINKNKAVAELRKRGEELAAVLNNAFQNAFVSGFESIGESIGNVLSGQSFGSGLISVISSLLKELGTALIKYGIIKEGIDKIFGAGGFAIPGAVAIGLGIAAIAASSIFKNSLSGRAAGGPVGSGQPYVVGEQGRELFVPSTSGRIIPNNQLGGLSGSASPTILFNGRLAVSGNELKLLLNRTDRYQAANV